MKNKISDFKQFITAGKAVFTVKNTETNNRFTFRITKKENNNGTNVFFVSVLTGSYNESNYSYIGMITTDRVFRWTRKSNVRTNSMSFKAFAWLWKNRRTVMPEKLEFRHEGCCGRCGRKLTTPESIDMGFGPECIKHIMVNKNGKYTNNISRERQKQTSEHFTPENIIQEMLSLVDKTNWNDEDLTFLDPCCGDGNILELILLKKLENGHNPTQALSTIYGIELMPDNTESCRKRLIKIVGNTPEHQKIVNANIVCADALKYDFSFKKPIKEIFF